MSLDPNSIKSFSLKEKEPEYKNIDLSHKYKRIIFLKDEWGDLMFCIKAGLYEVTAVADWTLSFLPLERDNRTDGEIHRKVTAELMDSSHRKLTFELSANFYSARSIFNGTIKGLIDAGVKIRD